MNVLFLSQRVPWPPDRGDRITTWHFLRHFLARGDHVQVGCFAEEARDDQGAAHLRSLGAEVAAPRLDRRWRRLTCLSGLLTGRSLTVPFFASRSLQDQVDRWVSQQPPDLIYVYSSSMAQFALRHRGPVRLMQFAELDSDKWRQFAAAARGPLGRWLYGREARELLAFETRVAREFELSAVVSDVERELFLRLIPGVEPLVLPNGVDVDHFRTAGDAARHPRTAIFTGVMDYEPNIDGVRWFVAECWPALRQRFADAQLLIVGSRPAPAVQELARTPGVTVTGRVPETPPFFDRAAVAIAPLRLARGVQNKVLEAMSMALPVVSSPQAAQGLGDVPADTLRIAADAAATTAAVAELFADPAAARAMGERAGAWVRTHCRWENMHARLDRALTAAGVRL